MDIHLIASFAVATLSETLSPGPTLALVVGTRTSFGAKDAASAVGGITVANIAWVVIAIFLVATKWELISLIVVPAIRYFAAAYLIYLASRRILGSSVQLVAGLAPKPDGSWSSRGSFLTGFVAHLINPLTVGYYLSTFSVATAGRSIEIAFWFGAIAVLSDLVVYGCVARVDGKWFTGLVGHFPSAGAGQRDSGLALCAGLALFYFVAHVFSKQPQPNADLSVSPVITLLMLVGFLFAAMVEAYQRVVSVKGKSSKRVWRIVALWSTLFSVAALLGALYSAIRGFGTSALSLGELVEHRVRICAVVAAVIAAALSFAKVFGELQDDLADGRGQDLEEGSGIATCWQASPLIACTTAFGFLGAVFLLLMLTGFRVQ